MPKITRKKILYLVVATIFIFFIWLMLRGCGKNNKVIYEFEKASIGEVSKTISVTGNLDIIDDYQVRSQISGIIQRVYVDFNQEVKSGQILATIDSSEIDERMMRISLSLESSKLNVMVAESDFQAKKDLYKENLIAKQGFEQSELRYKLALADHKRNLLDYNSAQKDKNNTAIIAPVSGIILSMSAIKNIAVSRGSVLFTIVGSLKNMLLSINIDESDIGYVKKDQDVNFTISAYPDKNFIGKLIKVMMAPTRSGSLVSYQATVKCDNSEYLLKPGMSATATVMVNVKKNVLRVLNQALLVNPKNMKIPKSGKFVWRKKSAISTDSIEPAAVKIGLMGDMYTEIVSGLKEKDEVLIRISDPESKKQ